MQKKTTKLTPRTFKAWPENEERLTFADKIGLNVSEVINETLKLHLKNEIEKKSRVIREALSAPCP